MGTSAATWATRGPPSSTDSSPKNSPGPSRATTVAVAAHPDHAVDDDEEPGADLALARDDALGREVDLDRRPRRRAARPRVEAPGTAGSRRSAPCAGPGSGSSVLRVSWGRHGAPLPRATSTERRARVRARRAAPCGTRIVAIAACVHRAASGGRRAPRRRADWRQTADGHARGDRGHPGGVHPVRRPPDAAAARGRGRVRRGRVPDRRADPAPGPDRRPAST